MLWVPQKGIVRREHNMGTVGTLTPGTAVTTGAAAGTKGAVAQIFAATAFDAYWVRVIAHQYSLAATDSQGALDILIGASTEEVLIPDLLMGCCGTAFIGRGRKCWFFPLYIPAGSRIAAQACGQRVSTAFRVIVSLYGGNAMPAFRVGRKVTTYGISALPSGTTVVPGASGAEGTWTQIAAATSEDHFCFAPSFQPGNDTTKANLAYAVDIGIGAATEQEIGNYVFGMNTDEVLDGPYDDFPTFIDVPSGTRLAMRASNSGVNDTGNYNGVIHAVS